VNTFARDDGDDEDDDAWMREQGAAFLAKYKNFKQGSI